MADRDSFSLARRAKSFRYAFAGIHHVFRTQQNAWIHGAINVAAVVLGIWLAITAVEWAILVLAMMSVWVAEFVNTAVEAAVDLATDDHEPLAATAKDVAAGGVLIAAIGAAVVGLLVLGPPLWQRLLN